MEWTVRPGGAELTPTERLTAFVGNLVRARRRQMAFRILSRGLLASILGAVALVLVLRASAAEVALWKAVGALTLAGLAISGLLAWRHRPDPLAVAIAADVRLRLKQRLSTAFEYLTLARPDDVTEALARRAFRARLPTRTDYIFPIEYDLVARAVPVAAIALVLVATFQVHSDDVRGPALIDEQVAMEGAVLGEHGRQLGERSRRGAMNRAERQAREMERLGERMSSGLVSRAEALDRLRALADDIDSERLAALDEGPQTEAPPLRVREIPQRGGRGGLADLRSAIERALAGSGNLSDEQKQRLESLGLSPEALERALEDLADGNARRLEELREKIAEMERSVEESEALGEAGDAVGRARRNLGDDSVAQSDPSSPESDQPMPFDGEDGRSGMTPQLPSDDLGDGDSGRGSSPGRGLPDQRFGEGRERQETTPGSGAAVTINVQGQLGEGEVFSSQVRVLPTLPEDPGERQALSRSFRNQAEAVMGEQAYPPHRKAFLRRYFLNLSEGTSPAAPEER